MLFAVVDHRYRFMYVSVGSPGKNHDAAVFESSRLGLRLGSFYPVQNFLYFAYYISFCITLSY